MSNYRKTSIAIGALDTVIAVLYAALLVYQIIQGNTVWAVFNTIMTGLFSYLAYKRFEEAWS